MVTPGESASYRWTILTLYVAGVALNVWWLVEMAKETEEGTAALENVKHKLLDPVKRAWERYTLRFHSQMVIEEAESLLRGRV